MMKRILFASLLMATVGPLAEAGEATEPAKADKVASADSADGAEAAVETKPFQSSDNPMADVDAAIARAGASGKLALIVLGANWCHDSRGLLNHLDTPDAAAFLDTAYEVQLIDVGLFEHGADIVRRFGMPVIFATPTVLIVDPMSGHLINGDNMHQWRDADSISAEDTLAYFMTMATDELLASRVMTTPSAPSAVLAALYADIDAFEAAQAKRIYGGYDVLRPLMATEKEDLPEEFMDFWVELRGLRYAITGDMARLRAEARAVARTNARSGDAASEDNSEADMALVYPEYPKFSWE